ncbi:hypothetical protein Y032_0045g1188 [Ancylostoma ceylanicum]|uniref:Uncharacterized protein n=1 Tax=Ancylostoma ceylanicum TaxID=53326 RepID=A0A016UDP2_9BILA|nr:hypothetical protein Y032_0045g1188 [Ancylostoma ceylanicum]
MASKPVFRDRVCTSFLEQIYVQKRASPLISSLGQANTCSTDVAAVAGSQHSLERIRPCPKKITPCDRKNQIASFICQIFKISVGLESGHALVGGCVEVSVIVFCIIHLHRHIHHGTCRLCRSHLSQHCTRRRCLRVV